MTWLDYARKNNIEPCVKDKDGRIVAWCVGYSDNELKKPFEAASRMVCQWC